MRRRKAFKLLLICGLVLLVGTLWDQAIRRSLALNPEELAVLGIWSMAGSPEKVFQFNSNRRWIVTEPRVPAQTGTWHVERGVLYIREDRQRLFRWNETEQFPISAISGGSLQFGKPGSPLFALTRRSTSANP